MIYLDTSALAKAYISEMGSDAVRDLLIKSESSMHVSTLSLVEFRCAIGRRVRAGSLTESESQRILASFQSDLDTDVFEVLPIDNAHHVSARRLIDAVSPLPLKALDALHLAVLQRTGATDRIEFITSDAQQAQAARALGITTQTIALKI